MQTFAQTPRFRFQKHSANQRRSGQSDVPHTRSEQGPAIQAKRATSSCACGGGCPTCTTLQRSPGTGHDGLRADTIRNGAQIHAAAKLGTSRAGGPLPFAERIQRSFGRHDVSHVVAHTDPSAATAAHAMGASAFTAGEHVAFTGQPSLHTAAHEATHAIQQRSGVRLAGGVGQRGDRYEQQADAVAERVAAGKSSEDLLDGLSSEGTGLAAAAVQREEAPKTAEEKRKADIQAQYRAELGSVLGDALGGVLADTLAPDKLAGYIDKGFEALTTLATDSLKTAKSLSPQDSAVAQAEVAEMGAKLRAKAAEFLKTEEGKKFLATVSKYASKPELVLPAAALFVQAAMLAVLYAYKKIDLPNIPLSKSFGDFTVALGLDLGQAKVLDVPAASLGLAYEKKNEAKGTATKLEVTGEYKPGVEATKAPEQLAIGAGVEDKRKVWGAKLEQKFGTKFTLTDWKPAELEAAYHIGLAFETKNYTPPQIAFLQGTGGWTRTVTLFSDVLSKTRFDAGTFSGEDLNIRLGMSYVLNRKPTVTRTTADGTTFVEKVNPVNFSIAPYLGLGVAVGSPSAAQAPASTAAPPAAAPKDDGGVKFNPGLGVKVRLDF